MAEIKDESSVDRDLTALQSAFAMGDEEIISNLAAKYQSFFSSLTLRIPRVLDPHRIPRGEGSG